MMEDKFEAHERDKLVAAMKPNIHLDFGAIIHWKRCHVRKAYGNGVVVEGTGRDLRSLKAFLDGQRVTSWWQSRTSQKFDFLQLTIMYGKEEPF